MTTKEVLTHILKKENCFNLSCKECPFFLRNMKYCRLNNILDSFFLRIYKNCKWIMRSKEKRKKLVIKALLEIDI